MTEAFVFPSRDEQLDTAENPVIPSKRYASLVVDFTDAEPAGSLPEVAANLLALKALQRTTTPPLDVVGGSATTFLQEVGTSGSLSPLFVQEVGGADIPEEEILSVTLTPSFQAPYNGCTVVVTFEPGFEDTYEQIVLEYPRFRAITGMALAENGQTLIFPEDLSEVYSAAGVDPETVEVEYEVEVRKLNNRG